MGNTFFPKGQQLLNNWFVGFFFDAIGFNR